MTTPLALATPFVLVLDDLHVIIEPLIYTALDYLLERLPSAMRLVITTRHDPPLALARLRARGQLTELRLADLRFTSVKAAAFLNERLHLALSTTEVDNLHARTEGWAVGLRLLGVEPSPHAAQSEPGHGLFIPETGETLTSREIEILRHLATGASNPVIAQQLALSPHTVKRHVANIFMKLNVSTRTEASPRARDLGLL